MTRRRFWTLRTADVGEATGAILANFLLHWFPAKVYKPSLAWSYSAWLGTVSGALFFLLVLSGLPLMFLYIPSVERAYQSVKDIEFVITFGSWIRAVHRIAAHGMVIAVFLHLVRVFLTGAYKNGLAVGAYLCLFPVDGFTTKLAIPFLKRWMPELGVAYAAFGMLVIVGCSNAVNLTDGLDGLAIVPTLMAAATFTLLAYVAGHAALARYLQVIFVRGASELPVFAAALVGASLGFLWYNAHPAQVFMGDTGSLALGGALATVALITKNELILVVAGGCFVVEALSVIIQVFWFRRTGQRVFRMAPIHHHYELNGLPEPKIIVRFWIVSFVLQVISLTTLKLR